MSEHHFAVLVDGENISPRFLAPILAEINRSGEIILTRVYGDWTEPHMGGWKGLLQSYPVRPIQQFRYGENASDGALIMDAIEIVSTNRNPVNAFCIVSSDSDFYSLALRLREHGMYVTGIGRQGTKSILVRSCNRFIYLENLGFSSNPPAQEEEQTSSPGRVPVEDIVRRAYEASDEDSDGWLLLAHLGQSIRRENSDFDPRSYNYTNLLDILRSYPEVFEVRSNGKTPPVYWMRPIPEQENPSTLTGVIKRFMTNYGFIRADKGDYFFTKANLPAEQRNIHLKSGTPVEFVEIKAPDSSGDNSAEKNGRARNVVVVS
ncbi:MAG TPA: NYN domain-containing protein [Limnochordia bacterium]|nr:NYN domain-containing protein [Limnochordia bacterium]